MESCIECNLETKHFIHPSDSWRIHDKVVFQPLFADSFRETLHAVLQRSAVMASSNIELKEILFELLELEEILVYTRWNTSKRIRQVVLSGKGWYIWKNSLRTVFLWVFQIAPCRINQFPLPVSWCRLWRTRVVFCRSFWKNNNTFGECSSRKPNELKLILDCFLRKSVSVQCVSSFLNYAAVSRIWYLGISSRSTLESQSFRWATSDQKAVDWISRNQPRWRWASFPDAWWMEIRSLYKSITMVANDC